MSMRGGNPIVNAPGRESYYTNAGNPYSTVDQPTDLANIDPLAQPKDAVFLNRDNSGTRATHQGRGVGLLQRPPDPNNPAEPPGRNLIWDNQEGTPHGNTGQNIGVVKTTAGIRRSQSYSPALQDQPFTQYGGTNRAIGGRRLVGTANPTLRKRQLHLRDTITEVREFALKDPRNPFVVEVVGRKNVSTFFPQEVVDTFTVKGQSKRFQTIPLDRSFELPATPQNTDMNKLPYLNQPFSTARRYLIGDLVLFSGNLYRATANMDPGPWNPVNWQLQGSVLSNVRPYIRDVAIQKNLLDVTVTAALQGAGTMAIDWGTGTPTTGVASGVATTFTYPASGLYDITISNEMDPNDVQVMTSNFVRDAGWTPTDLAWDPAFADPAYDPWVVNGRTITLANPLVVTGSPFIKLIVYFGEESGSLQNLHGFLPTSSTLTNATFSSVPTVGTPPRNNMNRVIHTFTRPGTYMVKIIAEHLVDDPQSSMPIQERRQIQILKPVRVF